MGKAPVQCGVDVGPLGAGDGEVVGLVRAADACRGALSHAGQPRRVCGLRGVAQSGVVDRAHEAKARMLSSSR